MIKDFSCFYNGVRLFLCGVFILALVFKGSAQNLASGNLSSSIGVTDQTVAHAVALRYAYFHYTSSRSVSSSNRQAQAFNVGQPKFALPSAYTAKPLAFNSRSADVILSNMGLLVGGILGGINYHQPK